MALGDSLRTHAEIYDNLSEEARKSADNDQAAALTTQKGLDTPWREELINGLGSATDNNSRRVVVEDIWKKCSKKLSEIDSKSYDMDAAAFNYNEYVKLSKSERLLKNLLSSLKDIEVYEAVRDGLREVAASLDHI